jgi:hypothetical protein
LWHERATSSWNSEKKTFFHTKSHSFTGPHPPQIPHDAGVYDLNLVVTGVSSLNIGFV